MRKFFFAISLFLLVATSLEAQESSVEVRPIGRELLETEPRKIVTTVFRVANNTSERQEFISSVKVPEGWILITRDFPFQLLANEADIRLVSFLIPWKALAGKYEVTYLVKARKYPDISDFCTIQVVVLPVAKLEVKSLQAPEYVIAGEDYQASFVVINEGNIEYAVGVRVDSGENYPFVVDTEKFRLAPGESKTVKVVVETDVNMRKLLRHRLQLTAQVFKDEEIKAEATSFTEVIPRITGVNERFHRIPGEITFRQVSEERKYGFQTEISGQGTLDEEGKRHIRFFLRGPDILDESIFGERDDYYFDYWTKDYELHLGHRSYSLSPLTENYRYGRGIEGKLNLNNFSLGAYHLKTPWLKPEEEQTAGYIDYSISENYRLRLNYLKKERANDEIVSLHGQLNPAENIDVELEYAYGKKGRKNNREDHNAYLVRLYGYHNRISYLLRFIHAGPDYSGYYHDSDSLSGGLAVPLGNNLRLNVNFRQQKDNLDLDPALYSAPLEKYYQLGLNYRFKTGTNVSLDWRDWSREDLLPQPEFDYEENTYRLGASHRFRKLALYTSLEFGKSSDNLTSQNSKLERYTLSSYFRPTRWQSYSGYLQYSDDGNFGEEKRPFMTAGLDGSFQIGTRNFLGLHFQTKDYQDDYDSDKDIFEIRFSHTLPNEHKILVRGRHTSYGNSEKKEETALMAEYTIPFRLPVSRKRSIGVVKGHVYDEETKQSIPDVIIRVSAATAVTDKNGNFAFPSLKPGTHYLTVDRGRIGLNRVAVQKNPMEVAVEGGEETWVELGITRGATLFGQIMACQFENNHNNNLRAEKNGNNHANHYIVGDGNNNNGSQSSDEAKLIGAYGLANILVELTSASEIKRCVTDRKGRFRFEELRPGKWTVRMRRDNLPEYHYFEKDTFEFELKPGEEKEILVKAVPKKRSIRIIEQGGILLEEKK